MTRRAATDGLEAVREVALLVTALHGLRGSAGQVIGWAPFSVGPTGYPDDWSDDDDAD